MNDIKNLTVWDWAYYYYEVYQLYYEVWAIIKNDLNKYKYSFEEKSILFDL